MLANNNGRLFRVCAYSYLSVPVLVFLATWVKLQYAVPIILGSVICLIRIFKQNIDFEDIHITKRDSEKLLIVMTILMLWVLLAGVGGFVVQSDDHNARNGMFEALVTHPWPLNGSIELDGTIVHRGFSYYCGFWILPALIGKGFGLRAGYYFQVIWAFIGLCIFFSGVCFYRRKIEIWPLVLFIFFSGLDMIGWYVTGFDMSQMTATKHLEWWTKLQFTSNTSQLFWVFNQCIPAWIVTMLFLIEKKSRTMLFLFSVSLISCTLPCIGLIPIGVYKSFISDSLDKSSGKAYFRSWLKDVLTFENIWGILTIGVVSFCFLMKGGDSEPIGLIERLRHGGWVLWLVSLSLEVGVYAVFLYSGKKRDPLFWVVMGWLALCPLIPVFGGYNFCMRASIPALIIVFFFVIDELIKEYRLQKYVKMSLLLGVLFIGALTPVHEFNRTISKTIDAFKSGDQIRTEAVSYEKVMANDYESVDIEKSIFYKYMAKQ